MLTRLKTGIEKTLLAIASAMLVAMVGLMLWQVFTRYVLQAPALYAEELLRFMMIWMAFLGTAHAFGVRRHLSLVFLTGRLQGRRRLALLLANDAVTMLFAGVIMFLGGLKAMGSSMEQFSPILRLPIGQVYLIMPLTAVLILVLQGLKMTELVRDYHAGRDLPEY
ncbi:TRAP transporter small permease [Mangrovicoccus ximenensis]|uniref:TRAP transporter small permease n=1 Tax=Mangrovicoccus ximenensis TaxID=1911570 RepID=UPI0013750ECF|nr:TRAP transporter small permease [Mangrovicoccus ximenensis]